jgi:hypothetical protein
METGQMLEYLRQTRAVIHPASLNLCTRLGRSNWVCWCRSSSGSERRSSLWPTCDISPAYTARSPRQTIPPTASPGSCMATQPSQPENAPARLGSSFERMIRFPWLGQGDLAGDQCGRHGNCPDTPTSYNESRHVSPEWRDESVRRQASKGSNTKCACGSDGTSALPLAPTSIHWPTASP